MINIKLLLVKTIINIFSSFLFQKRLDRFAYYTFTDNSFLIDEVIDKLASKKKKKT